MSSRPSAASGGICLSCRPKRSRWPTESSLINAKNEWKNAHAIVKRIRCLFHSFSLSCNRRYVRSRFAILAMVIIVIPTQLFLSSRPSAASGGICLSCRLQRSCFCHPDQAERVEGSVSVYLKNSKMSCSGLGKFINFTQSIKTS